VSFLCLRFAVHIEQSPVRNLRSAVETVERVIGRQIAAAPHMLRCPGRVRILPERIFRFQSKRQKSFEAEIRLPVEMYASPSCGWWPANPIVTTHSHRRFPAHPATSQSPRSVHSAPVPRSRLPAIACAEPCRPADGMRRSDMQWNGPHWPATITIDHAFLDSCIATCTGRLSLAQLRPTPADPTGLSSTPSMKG